MRGTRTALIALLVALAGCSGLTGTDGPTATPDDTDTPGGDGAASFPPGTDRTGVENASALLDAHAAALNGTAHRASLTGDRSGPNAARTEVVIATDGRRTLTRISTDDRNTTVWRTGDGRATRRVAGGETTYAYAGGDGAVGLSESAGRLAQSTVVGAYLRAGEYAYHGTVTRDGRTLLYYEATSVDESALPNATATPEALDVDLYVSADGVVRRMSGVTFEGNATVEFSYRVRAENEASVSEPAWVDANAPARR